MSVGPRAPNTCSSQDTQDLWGAAMNVTGQMTEPHKGWKNVHWWGCQTPGGAGAGPAGVKRTGKGMDKGGLWLLLLGYTCHLPGEGSPRTRLPGRVKAQPSNIGASSRNQG